MGAILVNLVERIESYWSKRSDDFYDLRIEELKSDKRQLWQDEIIANLPDEQHLTILDVGCGPGFFSIILASAGYDVTAVDYTEEMLNKAKQNAGDLKDKIKFRRMDAHNLEFEEGEFDLIVTRNLTWNLKEPEKAYKSWYNVLRHGGKMINFDADYGKVSLKEEMKSLGEEHAHNMMDSSLVKECDDIKQELEISKKRRPLWDEKYLQEIGFKSCKTDCEISGRIYKTKDDFYNPTPMFKVRAVKNV